MNEHVGIIKLTGHALRLSNEVGREIAPVELHAFFLLDIGFEALAFFDGNHAVFADLFHRIGQLFTDFAVAVGRDRADLGDGFFIPAVESPCPSAFW